MTKRHWSGRLSCQCGKSFRSYAAEAVHRHNFPTMCKPKRVMIKHREELVAQTEIINGRTETVIIDEAHFALPIEWSEKVKKQVLNLLRKHYSHQAIKTR